jgi:hypothetical protein
MIRKFFGLVLIIAAIALAAAWNTQGFGRPFAPWLALFLFVAGANMFGPVSRLAGQMSSLKGKTVRVKVWGAALGDSGFELKSVSGILLGLHVYLRSPDGTVNHLKIAQPRGTVVGVSGAEVTTAKYIQWNGSKIKKPELPPDSREPLPKAFLIGIDERAETESSHS